MDSRDNRWFLIFAGCVVAALLAVAGINIYQARQSTGIPRVLTYSAFLEGLDGGRVARVVLSGQDIQGTFKAGGRFETYAPEDPGLLSSLRAKGVSITAVPAPAPTSWLSVVSAAAPLLLIVLVTVLLMRRMPGTAGTSGLGRARARRLAPAAGRVTFADVAGVDEARQGLAEIVDFLRDPRAAGALGGRIPHGVLLVGPPGTGKTLLARAIAGEAHVPFFSIAGSDFVEMFVGIGAARVRDLFGEAKKNAPCIIFMDEIDAVGRRRGAGLGSGNDEREQTLNQLLVEMDGFESKSGVILIAATNRPDVLDPALRRPGRFDREIVVGQPDVRGREQILAVHTRQVPLAADADLAAVARGTPGFSGADLMNLVNEAALLAARRRRSAVGMAELEEARDTVTMGAERSSHVMTDEERRLTAYREGGRALVAFLAPAADPVHKVTILTRGTTTGRVQQLPRQDQPALTLEQMTSRLAILMAGRAAEELVFGRARITSATAPDIEAATRLARQMVTRWGVSESLGPVAYAEDQEEVFLGRSIARPQTLSPQTAQAISAEVRRLVEAALDQARGILAAQRGSLEVVAGALLQRETLTAEEIRALVPAVAGGALPAQQPSLAGA